LFVCYSALVFGSQLCHCSGHSGASAILRAGVLGLDFLVAHGRSLDGLLDAVGPSVAYCLLIMSDIDDQQILNALHVPEDAGEHAEALHGMLVRIPDGWGRWISCSRGWYPLLVELDEQLRALLPNYVIHQVKEKFGGLRYYWDPGEEVRDPSDPGGEAIVGGEAAIAERERRIELAHKLVASAERRAGATCELCGAAGQLHRTRAGKYKTLCADCAEREGYVPAKKSGAL
jgi:RNA polymerase-binding transcription factor DksA